MSERQACRFTGFARSSQRYVPRRPPDTALRARLHELAATRRRWGYRQLCRVLRREGPPINHKRVQRVYQEEGLQVRRRRRKRRAIVPRTPMPAPKRANERWSMDFVRDTLGDGRVFRCFTLVDDCTRECPVIEVDFSLSGERDVRVLDRVTAARGYPRAIVCDNALHPLSTGRQARVGPGAWRARRTDPLLTTEWGPRTMSPAGFHSARIPC